MFWTGKSLSIGATPGSNPSAGLGDLAALYRSLIPAGAPGSNGATAELSAPGPKRQPHGTDEGSMVGDTVSRVEKQIASSTLPSMRVTPVWPYQIMKGWKIPAEMEQSLTSNLPGEIRAIVRDNVRDTATGQYILIPQGSRLVGTYGETVVFGQKGIPSFGPTSFSRTLVRSRLAEWWGKT